MGKARHRHEYRRALLEYEETSVPDEIVPEGRIGMTVGHYHIDSSNTVVEIKIFHGIDDAKSSNFWWEWLFSDGKVDHCAHHERDIELGENNITPIDLIAVYQAYEWFMNRPENGAYQNGETHD